MTERLGTLQLRLSNAARLDLPDFVGAENCEFAGPDAAGERFGEPFTALAIIVITRAAIKGLVAYLAERSLEKQQETIEIEVDVVHTNGDVEHRKITATSKGQGMTADLARQLGDVTGIAWPELTK